jgi:hypothetical protein
MNGEQKNSSALSCTRPLAKDGTSARLVTIFGSLTGNREKLVH